MEAVYHGTPLSDIQAEHVLGELKEMATMCVRAVADCALPGDGAVELVSANLGLLVQVSHLGTCVQLSVAGM